jgi:MoxR-like ATPase
MAADLATTISVIDACGKAHITVLLVSDPGMGKSSVIEGLAASQGVPCETVLGSIREPADFAGLPVVRETGVEMHPPNWALRLAKAGTGYLLLDELTTAPPATQAAMLRVAFGRPRMVGDLELPSGITVVAAANPPDKAADGWELAPPLANRVCHVPFETAHDEWLTGMTTGWTAPPASRALPAADKLRQAAMRAAVAGFIQSQPQLLHAYPANPAQAGGPWPSRRTWQMTADALAYVRDDDAATAQAIIFGLVGDGAGNEFREWRVRTDLPDTDDVIADPSIVDWSPKRPDRTWAVLSGVVAWAAYQGTQDAWRKAWGPLLHAASHGCEDVAAAAARSLDRIHPTGVNAPAAVRTRFGRVLADAGMDAGSAA